MYQKLSMYYNQLFKFNSHIKPFIKPYTIPMGQAIDLGCGTGRLTHVISELGMDVVGIDLDELMILEAKKNYPSLKFKVENMLDSLKDYSYDLITCFGNTLVHLNHKELNLLFEQVAHRLTDRGYFIIQILNYNEILKNKPRELKELSVFDVRLTRHYEYLIDSIRFETELYVGSDVFSGFTQLFPYQIQDLTQMIESFELKVDIYGDLYKNSVSNQSEYVYVVIKKS
jgi:SAM-dependent methyltransferase